jgi:hypothetical protein
MSNKQYIFYDKATKCVRFGSVHEVKYSWGQPNAVKIPTLSQFTLYVGGDNELEHGHIERISDIEVDLYMQEIQTKGFESHTIEFELYEFRIKCLVVNNENILYTFTRI